MASCGTARRPLHSLDPVPLRTSSSSDRTSRTRLRPGRTFRTRPGPEPTPGDRRSSTEQRAREDRRAVVRSGRGGTAWAQARWLKRTLSSRKRPPRAGAELPRRARSIRIRPDVSGWSFELTRRDSCKATRPRRSSNPSPEQTSQSVAAFSASAATALQRSVGRDQRSASSCGTASTVRNAAAAVAEAARTERGSWIVLAHHVAQRARRQVVITVLRSPWLNPST